VATKRRTLRLLADCDSPLAVLLLCRGRPGSPVSGLEWERINEGLIALLLFRHRARQLSISSLDSDQLASRICEMHDHLKAWYSLSAA